MKWRKSREIKATLHHCHVAFPHLPLSVSVLRTLPRLPPEGGEDGSQASPSPRPVTGLAISKSWPFFPFEEQGREDGRPQGRQSKVNNATSRPPVRRFCLRPFRRAVGPGLKPHGLCQASASRRRRVNPTSVVRLIPGRPCARPALRGRNTPAGTLGRNLPGRQATLARHRRRRLLPTRPPSRTGVPAGGDAEHYAGGFWGVDKDSSRSNEFKGLAENRSTACGSPYDPHHAPLIQEPAVGDQAALSAASLRRIDIASSALSAGTKRWS
jgi:hypothetical protein